MGFSKDDLVKYKGFKSIIDDAKYEIQGNAVMKVAVHYQWFGQLEAKLKEAIANCVKDVPSSIKPIGKPKKIKKDKKDDNK